MLKSDKQSTWLLLCSAVVVHVALALPPAFARRDISHDEAITLLAISGHQAQYNEVTRTQTPPVNVWTPAREWQQFEAMDPGRPPELGVIAKDLGQFDIHPPLYFWIFSIVARSWGATPAVGLGLNLAFDVLTIFATFFLAKQVCRSDRVAALAAFLWAISPGPLEAGLEIRQYALVGLLVATFAIFAAKVFDSNGQLRPVQVFAVSIVCALGVLTHYHFLLVVLAAVVVAMLSLGEKSEETANPSMRAPRVRRNALVFAISSIVGVALGFAAHPYVFEVLERQGSQAQHFKLLDVPVRVGGVFVGMGRFFVWSVPLIVAWMVALVIGGILAMRAPKGWIASRLGSLDGSMRRLLIWLVLIFGAQVALFLAFRSPAGAMRAKYLVLDYSLCACLVAWLLTRAAVPPLMQRILVGVMFVSTIIASGTEILEARKIDASMPVVLSTQRMILDTVARGSLPVTLWNVPPSTAVFAASQRVIIERLDTLFADLEPHTLVIVDPSGGNANDRALIVDALSKRYRVTESRPAVFGGRIVYEVGARLPAMSQ